MLVRPTKLNVTYDMGWGSLGSLGSRGHEVIPMTSDCTGMAHSLLSPRREADQSDSGTDRR